MVGVLQSVCTVRARRARACAQRSAVPSAGAGAALHAHVRAGAVGLGCVGCAEAEAGLALVRASRTAHSAQGAHIAQRSPLGHGPLHSCAHLPPTPTRPAATSQRNCVLCIICSGCVKPIQYRECRVCIKSINIACNRITPCSVVWPLESLIPLEEEDKPSNIPGGTFALV